MLFASLHLLLHAAPALGQDDVVVTGRGLNDPPTDVALGVVRIERGRIEADAADRLESVLADAAGPQQFRRSDSRSADPTSQGIKLRDLGGDAASRALLLLDGVPQADPFGGWVAFPAYATERLGRVSVTRGGGSGYLVAGADDGHADARPAQHAGDRVRLAAGGRAATAHGAERAAGRRPAGRERADAGGLRVHGRAPDAARAGGRGEPDGRAVRRRRGGAGPRDADRGRARGPGADRGRVPIRTTAGGRGGADGRALPRAARDRVDRPGGLWSRSPYAPPYRGWRLPTLSPRPWADGRAGRRRPPRCATPPGSSRARPTTAPSRPRRRWTPSPRSPSRPR